ncbi:hypothetical protein [Bradyrhizobium cosmicum]|uniref:hypothetical protein n=1 Tax=Bradyrhizobium cosmicum TaxID=1404864 RepID=UPI0011628741|nr:hypothetical protein [Bradyrhizobium cosmicum]QDP21197.1 hypothetical protein FNV92_03025 [Bradyrhizobium cosmicum]
MPEAKEWRAVFTDFGPDVGEPSEEAILKGVSFDSLGEAIDATASAPAGSYSWIYGSEGVVFFPNQIKPLRKLRYKPVGH